MSFAIKGSWVVITKWDLSQGQWSRIYMGHRLQRIHHGPPGLIGGLLFLLTGHPVVASIFVGWGLSDWHDARLWFKRERLTV